MSRVECYRNLHFGTWSVRALDGPNKGRVISHPDTVRVDNAQFVVQAAGRERVRAEGRKNVHAFVRGDFVWSSIGGGGAEYPEADGKATYDPYENETFVDKKTRNPVRHAGTVILDIDTGVWYSNSWC